MDWASLAAILRAPSLFREPWSFGCWLVAVTLPLASKRWLGPSKDPTIKIDAWMARQDPTAPDQRGNPFPMASAQRVSTIGPKLSPDCLGQDLSRVSKRTRYS